MATGSFFCKTWEITSTSGGTEVRDGQRFEIKKYSDGYGFVVLAPSSGGTHRLGDGHWPDVRLQLKEGKLTGTAQDTHNRVTISKTSDTSIHCDVESTGAFQEQAGEWDAEDDGGSWDTEGRRSRRRPRRATMDALNIRDIRETETHVVVMCESALGRGYAVRYPKRSGYRIETIERELARAFERSEASDSDNYADLKWVYHDDSWTSIGAINLGIIGGRVHTDLDGAYRYEITFANWKGSAFTFRDETGDTYSCITVRNGNHNVDYNSSDPTIDGVRLYL